MNCKDLTAESTLTDSRGEKAQMELVSTEVPIHTGQKKQVARLTYKVKPSVNAVKQHLKETLLESTEEEHSLYTKGHHNREGNISVRREE